MENVPRRRQVMEVVINLLKEKAIEIAETLKTKYRESVILFVILAAAVLFVSHNYFLYDSTIVKVKKIETGASDASSDVQTYDENSAKTRKETYNSQKLTCRIMNGRYKGKNILLTNKYSYSALDTEQYRKGDELFIKLTENGNSLSGSITGIKRDKYAALLAGVLVFLVILVAKRRGIGAILSLAVNVGIFAAVLQKYDADMNFLKVSYAMAVLFTVSTILLVNGFKRQSGAAAAATLVTAALNMGLFFLAFHYGSDMDYSQLDYLTGNQDWENLFLASTLLASLGAIMDVAVSVAASMNELVKKNPEIHVKDMFRSGREIGHDIMGTMISVLLFTYICGLIPSFILKMKNDYSLITLVRLHIPFEISRFLTGSIGILLAIPVSIVISIVVLKMGRGKRRTNS